MEKTQRPSRRLSSKEAVSDSTLYELLEILPSAPEEEVRAAISQQSAKWSKRVAMAASMEKRHEAELAVQRIVEARRVLLDSAQRRLYDASLGNPPAREGDEPPPSEKDLADRVAPPPNPRWQEIPTPHPPKGNDKAGSPSPTPDTVPCPYCVEAIRPGARKCRWCGEWLDQASETSSERQPTAETINVIPLHSGPSSAKPGLTVSPPTNSVTTTEDAAPLTTPAEVVPQNPEKGCLGCLGGPGGCLFWGVILLLALRACGG